MSKKAHCN